MQQQARIEKAITEYLTAAGFTYDSPSRQFVLQPGEATRTVSPSVLLGYVLNALLLDD